MPVPERLNRCGWRAFAGSPIVADKIEAARQRLIVRICCEFPANSRGHRYLFGLLALGGLLCDLPNDACRKALEKSQKVLAQLNELEKQLRVSSSFLDRLEEVGIVPERTAMVYGLLGPIARASGHRPRFAPRAAVSGL